LLSSYQFLPLLCLHETADFYAVELIIAHLISRNMCWKCFHARHIVYPVIVEIVFRRLVRYVWKTTGTVI
jgi:hypothetical protein